MNKPVMPTAHNVAAMGNIFRASLDGIKSVGLELTKADASLLLDELEGQSGPATKRLLLEILQQIEVVAAAQEWVAAQQQGLSA